MHKDPAFRGAILLLLISSVLLLSHPVFAEFSYQGKLMSGTASANGAYDFTFAIYEDSVGGAPMVSPVTLPQVPVVEGLFTVVLPFESALFDGEARWLEINVRPAGQGQFVALQPRQMVTPTPCASFATRSGTAGLAQAVAQGSITLSNLEPALATTLVSNASHFDTITVTNGIWVGQSNRLRVAVLQHDGSVSVLSDPVVSQFPKIEFGTNINGGPAGVGVKPTVGWQANHGGYGGEVHLTSPGNISINANYDGANPHFGVQLGSSGPFHDRLYIQYDYIADTEVPLGYSKVFEFRSTYLDTNNVVRSNNSFDNTWEFGFRQESMDRAGDCRLVLYSMTPVIIGKRNPNLPYHAGNNALWSTGVPLVSFLTNRVEVHGGIHADGGLRVGGQVGAKVTSILSAAATLDFGSTAPQQSADLVVPVPGAASGDVVSLGTPNQSVLANMSYSAWVSAPDNVTVRLNNYGTTTIDPEGGVFRVMVTRF